MLVYTDVQAFWGEYDVSGEANKFVGSQEVEIKDSKVFNQTTIKRDPGLFDFNGSLAGVIDGTSNAMNNIILDSGIGGQRPFSLHVESNPGVVGGQTRFADAIHGGGSVVAAQGELNEFNMSLAGDSALLVAGKILAIGTKTSTADGAGVQMPAAVADGQSVYAVLHCTASTGTIDVVIESDAGDTWSGAETTRFTFTQVVDSTPTYQFMKLTPSGGISDTWWRATWTSASTPSHAISVSLGIR